ncbi:hypothetical protein D3218_13190 [Aureimonas flava]|uniref:Uncharacterized protein n=1 Tax=Aureimonas flava TaxID=2320271 RepID=A0A3A1WI20_9HYPH|nr:hypothetical protein [Aureimonas flava]RIY00234.1 hypothetical protein D3218_13190 [Aureimonas flava]
MTNEGDPPRRQGGRMIHDGSNVPQVGRGDPFYPPNPGAVQWLDEDDREKVESLIRMEPDLAQMVQARRSWALVLATLKTIAVWLTAMSGGLLVMRELLKAMQQ